jgi:RNA polymerase sigma-70 factor (ECF subfamily)
MPTEEELSAWIRAVAEIGDRSAFAALFMHFAPRIKGLLVRGGANDELAEELSQETMVIVWRRASSFDPARAELSAWLYTIARNLRIDQHRRAGRRVLTCDRDPEQHPAEAHLTPDELLDAIQGERNLHRALADLPVEQAEVLRLSFFAEQPHGRIAHELGIPLGTVKSRIRLAVRHLRRLLEQYRT